MGFPTPKQEILKSSPPQCWTRICSPARPQPMQEDQPPGEDDFPPPPPRPPPMQEDQPPGEDDFPPRFQTEQNAA